MRRSQNPDDKVPAVGAQEASGPRSLTRLLALFDTLSLAPNGMTLAEISIALESPKSSLLNLLRPLVGEGFLTHNEAGIYHLGPAIFRLSASVLSASRLTRMIRPFLQELVDITGESAMWGELSRETGDVMFTDVADSPNLLRLQMHPGVRRPLYGSPTGWVLLAYADKAWRDHYLATTQPPTDMQASVTRTFVQREMTRVRAEGVLTSIEVAARGIGSVTAPIFNDKGDCIGAMNVAGPAGRFRANVAKLEAAVKSVAAKACAAAAQAHLEP